ncbi:hypothetical protein A4W93_11730 [Piscinibacter gummiphilus]|uniref:Uncharacterized protein n=1 Tax=Piscinibacter gummiphilus TaxID=946333 RepID=A0A1W6LHZ5_9BURK|nr:hypothetical protein A4W93_11730 [Piscinibacter gummiphilus]
MKKAPAAKPAAPAKKAVAAKPAPAKKAAAAKKPAAAPVAEKSPKPVKQKLVRDSFTMPSSDFALIDSLKERALGFRRPTKKSELLRAGLQALAALTDAQLQAALASLEPLKTGRPRKEG